MRDIRPTPRKPRPPGMPSPAEDELYEVTQRPRKNTPLAGERVPVAGIHVPPTQAVAQESQTKPLRPLFAKTEVGGDPGKPKIRLGRRERMALAALLGVTSLVALLGVLLFLPKARVRLVLATAPLLVDQEVTIRADETNVPSVVPGTGFFREVGVEGTASVISTEMVGTKAVGIVDIINKTSEEQKIKERSRLVTKNGVLFYMTRSATVPAAGRVPVPVEAAEAGEVGNIEPQRLDFAALDSSAQSVVYGEATGAISGGTGEEIHVVKDEDIARAKTAAQEAAQAKVRDEIRGELPRGWVLLDESWTAELADFSVDGTIGDRQPQLAYTAQATVRVLGYEAATLEDRLTKALQGRLDQNYALFPGPISYSKTVKNVDWEKGEGVIVARVTHTTIPDFSLETLRQKIARRSADEAKQYLEGLPGVRSVDLTLSPFWVQSIPRIENRIDLELVPERQP